MKSTADSLAIKEKPARKHCALCKADTMEACKGCGASMHVVCVEEFFNGACVFCGHAAPGGLDETGQASARSDFVAGVAFLRRNELDRMRAASGISVQEEAESLDRILFTVNRHGSFAERLAAARAAFGAVGEEAVEPIASLSLSHILSSPHLDGTCDCPAPLGRGPSIEEQALNGRLPATYLPLPPAWIWAMSSIGIWALSPRGFSTSVLLGLGISAAVALVAAMHRAAVRSGRDT